MGTGMGRVSRYHKVKPCDPFSTKKAQPPKTKNNVDLPPKKTDKDEQRVRLPRLPERKPAVPKTPKQKKESAQKEDKPKTGVAAVRALEMREGESLQNYKRRLRELSNQQLAAVRLPSLPKQQEKLKARANALKIRKTREKLRKLGVKIAADQELPSPEEIQKLVDQSKRKGQVNQTKETTVDVVAFGEVAQEPPNLTRVPKMVRALIGCLSTCPPKFQEAAHASNREI
eukprot:c19950_g1_i1.p2 GENE.c19950_g1_i1~~c19950_g1_i1.p2  ORF type:complete len:229 (-),score=52.42 c19950_g1_i1:2457-3143(-)